MNRIAVVTTSRADYGIYRPLLRRLLADADFEPIVLVSGSHLSARHGMTMTEISADGVPVGAVVDSLLARDDPVASAKASGMAVIGFADALDRLRPDLVVALGDRFEMHSAGVAAVPLGIPLAHVHGGELTEGAMDDLYRHSLTKLAHLHLVATESHASRVRQMGEEPWRVTVTGALAIDDLCRGSVLTPEELRQSLGLSDSAPPSLVTLHSATRSSLSPLQQAGEVLRALDELPGPIVVTAPNADPGGDEIRRYLEEFARSRPDTVVIDSVGTMTYRSLMATSRLMVGNSSSGIIEAASFQLPVVNVGARQDGRERPANVLDVPYRREAIAAAIRRALEPAFRAGLNGLKNPYGDGRAADRAAAALRRGLAETDLLVKRWTVPSGGEFGAV